MATVPAMESSPTLGTQQAKQFDGLLQQSRDLICERLDRAVAGMLDKAKEVLSARIEETRSLVERRLYEETRNVVVAQRDTLEKQFRATYLGEFRRRGDRARKIGQIFGDADDSPGQLALVGEDDYEETLKFSNMAAKLRAYCDEELVALDQRVGVLLGDANLQANDNPFSPQVICDAYKQACRQTDASTKVRRMLLKLFDDHVLDDIRSMYKEVNALLIQNAILPKIRYGVSRSQDRKVPASGATAGAQAPAEALPPGADPATGAAAPQDLFSMLQNLVANNVAAMGRQGIGGAAGAPGFPPTTIAPGFQVATNAPGFQVPTIAPGFQVPTNAPGFQVPTIAPGFQVPTIAPGFQAAAGSAAGVQAGMGGVVSVLQGADLMGALTRIQLGDLSAVAGGGFAAPAGVADTTNVLRELKATSVGAGMVPMDVMTLDIVAMLFDQLFNDPKVPNGVKGIIGRMQIPMLKVAIADKSFFSTKTHPARRLLDTLGEIAARLPAEFSPADPLFARVQGILDELVDAFQEKMDVFTMVRERLEALLAEEDRRIEEETQATARRVEEMETLAVAKMVAAKEVKARVDANKLPGPIVDFLVQHWLKLLLLVHVKEGKESPAWKRAVEAMDHLIWSIEPKSTREERRKVVEVIPGLVKQIAVGLKATGVGRDARAKFFSRLMKYHRIAIAPPGESKSDTAPAGEAAPSQPESQAADAQGTPAAGEGGAAAAVTPDFSAPITVRNPFGGGDVEVASLDLDFTAIDGGGARAQRDAGPSDPLASLVVGTWVDFRMTPDQPLRRPAKLIFVTPRKTRYLFAFDRAGKDVLPFTPAELSRRFRVGDSVIIDEPRDESLFDRIMKGLVGKLRAPAMP